MEVKPLYIRNAEQLLLAMQASGLTPLEVAEALHTAVFLLGKGNGLGVEQMLMMATQEWRRLDQTTVFTADLPKGPAQ